MFERLTKLLAGDTTPAKMPDTQTKIRGIDAEKNIFARTGWYDNRERRTKIRDWMKKYRRGGPYADAMDAYPLFTLSKGWTLTCNPGDERLKEQVQTFLDQEWVDFDADMWQGVLSAILAGDSYQEVVMMKGGGIWGLVSRDPSMFRKDVDESGRVNGFTQFVKDDHSDKGNPIDPTIMINLMLFRVPGDIYGQSIWERADDDINRDCDIIESVTKAIHRHGTPKNLWNVGSEENRASTADIEGFQAEIKKIDAKTDFVVTHDVKATMLDATGIANVDTYSNVSLQRTSSSIGVPEEMLGLGRGSTEATATVRMQAFMGKISTIQTIVARTYSRKLLDRITGVPGAVWITFNKITPEDFAKMAEWMSKLRSGQDQDAVIPADWAREQFGIPKDEDVAPLLDPTLPANGG